MASFFKRLKRQIRDRATSVKRAEVRLNQVSEVDREAFGPTTAIQVATLAAMLGHAPIRGVKGGPRG